MFFTKIKNEIKKFPLNIGNFSLPKFETNCNQNLEIKEIKPLKKEKMSDAMFSMLASEEVLAKNWLSKEDEEAWKDL